MRVRNNARMPATNRALGGDNANFSGLLAGSLEGLLEGSLEGRLEARDTFNHCALPFDIQQV